MQAARELLPDTDRTESFMQAVRYASESFRIRKHVPLPIGNFIIPCNFLF